MRNCEITLKKSYLLTQWVETRCVSWCHQQKVKRLSARSGQKGKNLQNRTKTVALNTRPEASPKASTQKAHQRGTRHTGSARGPTPVPSARFPSPPQVIRPDPQCAHVCVHIHTGAVRECLYQRRRWQKQPFSFSKTPDLRSFETGDNEKKNIFIFKTLQFSFIKHLMSKWGDLWRSLFSWDSQKTTFWNTNHCFRTQTHLFSLPSAAFVCRDCGKTI